MKRKHRKNGFTLVEIIVVLVILAILAAIIVPSMVRWIDKSEEKSAIVEARTCLLAMQSLAVERYAGGGQYVLSADKAATLKLAESPAGADILQATVNATATVTMMVYKTADGIIVTYVNGTFTISRYVHSFGNPDDVKSVYDEFSKLNVGNDGIDSAAAAMDGTKAKALVEALKNAGLDLTAMGASSWKYMKTNDNGGPYFYWTTEDISAKAPGDKVIVMRYNANSNNNKGATYTVWETTVSSKKGPDGSQINVLSNRTGYDGLKSTVTDPASQTYSQMIQDYNKAVSGS